MSAARPRCRRRRGLQTASAREQASIARQRAQAKLAALARAQNAEATR